MDSQEPQEPQDPLDTSPLPPITGPESQALTVSEAARLANVCRPTIYAWIAAKKLDVIELIDGRFLVMRPSLLAWVQQSNGGKWKHQHRRRG